MRILNYHSIYLEKIKKRIGASFVGYETYKDKYAIRVIKDKVTEYFTVVGSPEFATPKSYSEVEQIIVDFYKNGN